MLVDGNQGAKKKLMENDTEPTKNDEAINKDMMTKNVPGKLTEEDNKPEPARASRRRLAEVRRSKGGRTIWLKLQKRLLEKREKNVKM